MTDNSSHFQSQVEETMKTIHSLIDCKFLDESQIERKLMQISGEMFNRNCSDTRPFLSLGAVRVLQTTFDNGFKQLSEST